MAAAPPPPALPVELVEEILLRLPPDDPACLLRASLVCKSWGGAVSRPSFRRRLHELHRAPPMLGFLHNWENEYIPRFIPTTASSFSIPAPDYRSWRTLDCRHGRALFLSEAQDQVLLVWEPITGTQQRVPVPAAFRSYYPTAAVFCAVDGCDHRDCLGGPFRVVFVFTVEEDTDDEEYVTSACLYSSETSTWGKLTSINGDFTNLVDISSLLVGRSLLYFNVGMILEYDLVRHSLNVFDTPDCVTSNLMLAEDGGLGVIQDFSPHLKLWSREVGHSTDARWLLSRVIRLECLLPIGLFMEGPVNVLGFAEGANTIFVTTVVGLFTIELKSQRVRRVCNDQGFCNLIPVVSFYTPHSRLEAHGVEHHYPPLQPSPTEEVGGSKEKTLEQTQKLFDKCKAMEEGNFTNGSDCFDHTLEIRVPHHGELPPDCARTFHGYGHALLCKTPEATDPLGKISKNAPNEESVKITSTTSKDDPGSSEVSGDEHGDSEEVLLC